MARKVVWQSVVRVVKNGQEVKFQNPHPKFVPLNQTQTGVIFPYATTQIGTLMTASRLRVIQNSKSSPESFPATPEEAKARPQ